MVMAKPGEELPVSAYIGYDGGVGQLGSDSEYLSTGTQALETVLAEHGDHPNAVYARLALGTNAARPFTAVQPDGTVQIREPDLPRADELLGAAVDSSRGAGGLDDLTVYQVLGYLAGSHEAADDPGTGRSLRNDPAGLSTELRVGQPV